MKKIVPLLLTLCMGMQPLTALANSGGYPRPAASEWAQEYIDKAEKSGVTEGFNGAWSKAVTRSEFCQLAYNALAANGEVFEKPTKSFTDTDDEKILALAQKGIIEGKSDDVFAPGDSLTREEAAVILKRICVHLGLAATEMYFNFDDADDISPWAMEAVQTVCNMGAMNGVGDGLFDPKGSYTAEQAVVTLMRIFKNIKTDADTFADKLNELMPDGKNYMFSPLSVKMALALAANGAEGETQSEMFAALGIDNLDAFNEHSKELIKTYSEHDVLKLDIANSIWLNESNSKSDFADTYKKTVSDFYSASANTVNSQNAVKEINSWVTDKTNGKITSIIDNSEFDAALLNAVYFKGMWAVEFPEEATKKDEFTNKDGSKSQIDFMNRTGRISYLDKDGITAVKLPYKNRLDKADKDGNPTESDVIDADVNMYLLMNDADSVNAESFLNKNADNFKSTKINLSMPKFELSYSVSLSPMLKTLGINKAFDDKTAQFEKMFASGSNFISDVLHKTYIKVTEKDTEAAAVTGVMVGTTALMPEEPPIDVKFNKPFTFVIKDDTSGEILFIGEYCFGEA